MTNDEGTRRAGREPRSGRELVGLGVGLFLLTAVWQWLSHALGWRPDYVLTESLAFAAVLAVLATGVQAWWDRRSPRRR